MNKTISQGSNFISIENKENQSMYWIEIVGFNDSGIEWKVSYYERFRRSGYHIVSSEKFNASVTFMAEEYELTKKRLFNLIESVNENNEIEF